MSKKKITYVIAVILAIVIITYLIVLIGDIKILVSETKLDMPYSYSIGNNDLAETTRASLLCKYFNGRKILYRSYWMDTDHEYCPLIITE